MQIVEILLAENILTPATNFRSFSPVPSDIAPEGVALAHAPRKL